MKLDCLQETRILNRKGQSFISTQISYKKFESHTLTSYEAIVRQTLSLLEYSDMIDHSGMISIFYNYKKTPIL